LFEQKTRQIKGWGRISRAKCNIFRPRDRLEVAEALSAGENLPRGGGMSFGDAALNDSRAVIETLSLTLSEEISFDTKSGILRCSAGTTQREILNMFGPEGWILPAIPGSKDITLGGSIAADGHGKNHYKRGAISQHLISMQIMLASGEVVYASREMKSDLFWVTIGGLGLTGVILSIELKLQKIRSVFAKHKIFGFDDVDGLINLIEEHKSKYEYILGWVDGKFEPRRRWQGAVSVGRNASEGEVKDPWAFPPHSAIRVPFTNPVPGTGVLVSRLVNHLIKEKFKHGRQEVIDLDRFFFPQDAIGNWNLAFGRAGFVDYQCCVPFDLGREFFKELHRFLSKQRMCCFLVAIKRFREPERNGPLTFVQNGYSIALDMPMQRGILEQLHSLDQLVVDYGGRINPVKDSRILPAMFRRMYPRLPEWLAIKEKYDPGRRFSSDLSRRLELTTG
jgi:decaprenylphospho-beta-D-ribofuranose 2-oxidase